jgi:hypothetical protein
MKIRVKSLNEFGWEKPVNWSPPMELMYGNTYDAALTVFDSATVTAGSCNYHLLPGQFEIIPQTETAGEPKEKPLSFDWWFLENAAAIRYNIE